MVRSTLVEHLRRQCQPAVWAWISQLPDLDRWLEERLADAVKAWPGVSVPTSEFLGYLAERLPERANLERLASTVTLEELYLCCACARGDPQAVACFSDRYGPVIRAALSRLGVKEPLREDIEQQLHVRLLVASGDQPPLIARYALSGRLRSWLWVVTSRAARDILAKERRVVATGDTYLTKLLAAAEYPDSRDAAEKSLAKATHSESFKRALKASLGSLSPRQQALLRYRYVDGFGLQEIARIYRIHHTTVGRQLDKLRKEVLSRTRERLRDELGLSEAECSSLISVFAEKWEVTLSTFFGDSE